MVSVSIAISDKGTLPVEMVELATRYPMVTWNRVDNIRKMSISFSGQINKNRNVIIITMA